MWSSSSFGIALCECLFRKDGSPAGGRNKMKSNSKRRLAMTAAVMIAGIFPWTFALARKDRSGKKELRKAIPIQAEISVQNGETLITMTPQAQKVAGIVAAP